MLQEGIAWSAAEVTESVGLNREKQLEEISSPDVGLVVDLELSLQLNFRVIFETLLHVVGAVGLEQS